MLTFQIQMTVDGQRVVTDATGSTGTHHSTKRKCNIQSTFSPRAVPAKKVAKIISVAAERMVVSAAQDVNVKAVLTWQSESLKPMNMEWQSISKLKILNQAVTQIVL